MELRDIAVTVRELADKEAKTTAAVYIALGKARDVALAHALGADEELAQLRQAVALQRGSTTLGRRILGGFTKPGVDH